MKRRNFLKDMARLLLLGGLGMGIVWKAGGRRREAGGKFPVSCRNCPMRLEAGGLRPEACLKSKTSCLVQETIE